VASAVDVMMDARTSMIRHSLFISQHCIKHDVTWSNYVRPNGDLRTVEGSSHELF